MVTMRITGRTEWGANPPLRPLQTDRLPWDRAWLHHSVTPSTDPAYWMRRIQTDHQGRGWRDFAYNFAGSQDGRCFEGIGLHRHLNSDAGKSAAFLWIGNYDIEKPTPALIEVTAWWLAHSLLSGWVRAVLDGVPHFTGGHTDIPGAATVCPGKHALAALSEVNDRAASIIYALRGNPLPPVPVPAPPKPAPSGGFVTVDLPVLQRGDRGGPVRSLQALLIAKANQDLGRAGADGDFGPATEAAVRNVQRFFGLAPDGIVGAQTWGVMFL